MQAYILSVAGAVLLSAVVSLILPEGKLSPLIRGMTKLITLVLLVSPLISLLRGGSVLFGRGIRSRRMKVFFSPARSALRGKRRTGDRGVAG